MSEINTWPGWTCIRQLGSGSYGKVYEIETVENGNVKRAALKVMSVPSSPEAIQEIYDAGYVSTGREASEYIEKQIQIVSREFKMMSELQGRSNIVEFEDYLVIPHEGWAGADILIRMELLTPLNQYMRACELTDTDIVNLGIDICHALQICHTMNPPILHRDIKMANIMVDARGNFKLGDFGIARIVDGTQYAHTRAGTWNHMAPEVYRGEGYYVAADIYSLGMVLYRLLNNNRGPFVSAEGVVSEQDAVRSQNLRLSGAEIPAPLRGSDELKAVVQKALAYEPCNRFKTAAEFGIALKNCPEFTQGSAGNIRSEQNAEYDFADDRAASYRQTQIQNKKSDGIKLILAVVGVILIWGCIFTVGGRFILDRVSARQENPIPESLAGTVKSKVSEVEASKSGESDSSEAAEIKSATEQTTDSEVSQIAAADSQTEESDENRIPDNAVVRVGDTYYTSVNEAISAIGVSAILSLVDDVKENVIIPEYSNITICLDGHTMTDNGDHTILNYGVLHIRGEGKVDNVTPDKAALVNEESGQAYLNGGEFLRSEENGVRNKKDKSTNTYYTVANYGSMTIDGATIRNKGSYSSTLHNGWRKSETRENPYAWAEMVINDGCHIEGGLYAAKNDLCGRMAVGGGEFSGSKEALLYNNQDLELVNGEFKDAPVAISNHGDGTCMVNEQATFDTDEIFSSDSKKIDWN